MRWNNEEDHEEIELKLFDIIKKYTKEGTK